MKDQLVRQQAVARTQTVADRNEVVLEAEAVKRAKQGNGEAFEFLYRLHKRRVYSVCLRMTASTAEDGRCAIRERDVVVNCDEIYEERQLRRWHE